jgi:hypothetical protein
MYMLRSILISTEHKVAHEILEAVSGFTDGNNKAKHDVGLDASAAVLNSYAHGATVKQCAKSAGVDVAAAYQ